MNLGTSFVEFLQPLAPVFTVPTFNRFLTVLTGWVFARRRVVTRVIVTFPFRPGHYVSLPILFRLYVNQKTATKKRLRHRTRPELAVEMLTVLCKRHENRRHAVGDSAYGGQSVLANWPANCDLTSRLVLSARLYAAPPARKPGINGRPRKRGQLLPTPRKMLEPRTRRADGDAAVQPDRAVVCGGRPSSLPTPQSAVVSEQVGCLVRGHAQYLALRECP